VPDSSIWTITKILNTVIQTACHPGSREWLSFGELIGRRRDGAMN
jgi:hypothetical protein